MQEELTAIVASVRENAPNIQTRAEFEAYKATISGPKGSLTDVMKSMGKVPKEDKPAMGKLINQAKTAVTAAFDMESHPEETDEILSCPAVLPSRKLRAACRSWPHPHATGAIVW